MQTTHEVEVSASSVLKRYRLPIDGEPEREFGALVLMAEHAPGLAPVPVGLTSEGGKPVLRMSRVEGRPLAGAKLTSDELVGVARAMIRLHDSVPADVLEFCAVRAGGPAELVADLRGSLPESVFVDDAEVVEAIDACRLWLERFDDKLLLSFPQRRVFTNADGNLSNYLWDGVECRIVDYEDAGVSDRSYEVADLLEHPTVSLAEAFSPNSLLNLLTTDDARSADLLAYRRLLAAYWFMLLLPGGASAHRNPPGSLRKQARHLLGLLRS